jgi:hypothetical protein
MEKNQPRPRNDSKARSIRAAVAAVPNEVLVEQRRESERRQLEDTIRSLSHTDADLLAEVVAKLKKSKANGADELHRIAVALLGALVQRDAR